MRHCRAVSGGGRPRNHVKRYQRGRRAGPVCSVEPVGFGGDFQRVSGRLRVCVRLRRRSVDFDAAAAELSPAPVVAHRHAPPQLRDVAPRLLHDGIGKHARIRRNDMAALDDEIRLVRRTAARVTQIRVRRKLQIAAVLERARMVRLAAPLHVEHDLASGAIRQQQVDLTCQHDRFERRLGMEFRTHAVDAGRA
jgi:hypothetical protein